MKRLLWLLVPLLVALLGASEAAGQKAWIAGGGDVVYYGPLERENTRHVRLGSTGSVVQLRAYAAGRVRGSFGFACELSHTEANAYIFDVDDRTTRWSWRPRGHVIKDRWTLIFAGCGVGWLGDRVQVAAGPGFHVLSATNHAFTGAEPMGAVATWVRVTVTPVRAGRMAIGASCGSKQVWPREGRHTFISEWTGIKESGIGASHGNTWIVTAECGPVVRLRVN